MLTTTAIEGGIGGHTEPSADTLEVAREGFCQSKKERTDLRLQRDA